jgi:hypothetical protein
MPAFMDSGVATERILWLDVAGAVFQGVFFAFFMWLAFYRRFRPKDISEEQK